MARGFGRSARVVAVVATGSVTTLVLLPIAINVGTGGTAPGFLAGYVGWLWPAVVGLTALTVLLGTWERLRDKGTSYLFAKADHPGNLEAARKRVERWAVQRRNSSLVVRVQLELALSAEPDMVVRAIDWVEDPDEPDGVAYTSDQVAELFDDKRHELLVLGAPGAGKSTLLLNLCLSLLAEARDDPERPVPVLIDLASWSTSGRRLRGDGQLTAPQDFRTWLVAQMGARYRIPPGTAKVWLRDGRIALLLDGLDEVYANDRARCVDEINALRQEHNLQIAVACRLADYERLKRRLALYDAVRIEPLDRGRLLDYFDAVGPALDGVRTALRRSESLWELLVTPLMLNIMALTYKPGRQADELDEGGTAADHHRRLFDDYVVEMLVRRRAGTAPFDDEQVIRGLRFLARLASSPLWNDDVARRRLAQRVAWLPFVPSDAVVGLATRVVPALLAGFAGVAAAVVALRYGMVPALVVSACLPAALFVMHRISAPAMPVDPRTGRGWRSSAVAFGVGGAVAAAAVPVAAVAEHVAHTWAAPTAYGLVLLATLVLGSVLAIVAERDGPVYFGVVAMALPVAVMAHTGPSPGLLGGLAVGLLLGAVFAVVANAFSAVWWSVHVPVTTRIPWSLLGGVVMVLGACAGLAAASPGAPVDAAVVGPVAGLLMGLAVFPVFTVDAFPVDVMTDGLAEVLARPLAAAELPWRRTVLLRFAAERILLIQVGAEYRFAHRLIRDHLADCDPVELAQRVRRRVNESSG
ncbi:hypothetical protein AB0H12_20800 [Actinosynnema sp. NPDC023794]